MKKSLVIFILFLIPVVMILCGFYLKMQNLISIGYVIMIFYIIMAIRTNFVTGERNKP
jgi:hypothetical protein